MTYFSGEDGVNFRTRVVILSSSEQLSVLAQQIFRSNDVSAGWIQDDTGNNGDFIILSTYVVAEAADFKPTIVLISSQFSDHNWQFLLQNITPGGILIYPQVAENLPAETSVLFRKLLYESAQYEVQNNEISLSTEFGKVTFQNLDENVAKDIFGLQLFCAQFGIMEEDFFATLAEIF